MEAGMAKDSGPIAELLAEHARAREFWQSIEKHARIVLGGGTNTRLELARQAAGYVALLTGHIRAGEKNLFPPRLYWPGRETGIPLKGPANGGGETGLLHRRSRSRTDHSDPGGQNGSH